MRRSFWEALAVVVACVASRPLPATAPSGARPGDPPASSLLGWRCTVPRRRRATCAAAIEMCDVVTCRCGYTCALLVFLAALWGVCFGLVFAWDGIMTGMNSVGI